MKKTVSVCMTAVMALSLLAGGAVQAYALSAETVEPVSAVAEENCISSSWKRASDPALTEKVRKVFDKAFEGLEGVSYTPVALLASSNPIGTIFSAIFISHISVGGSFLSTKYYPTEISDLISGIIIYLCAFSMLFRGKIHSMLFKNADKTNVNAEPAPAKTETKKEGK